MLHTKCVTTTCYGTPHFPYIQVTDCWILAHGGSFTCCACRACSSDGDCEFEELQAVLMRALSGRREQAKARQAELVGELQGALEHKFNEVSVIS